MTPNHHLEVSPARRGVVEQHWCREIHTNSTVPHSSSRMGSANMHFIVH